MKEVSSFRSYEKELRTHAEELRYSLHVVKKNPITLFSLVTIAALILIALMAPYVVPYPQDALGAVHPDEAFQAPSLNHFFGTDESGRDVFSRVLVGARISLSIGCLVVFLALMIGLPLGIIAGYLGGKLDQAIMRITDMFLSIPALLLALAFTLAVGASLVNSMIAIAFAWWPWYTRLARGQAMAIKERPFVEAARSVGVSRTRIMLRHILPNSITPIVVQASIDFGAVILTAASLSFLGLGAQSPTPEWGLMISLGRTYFLDSWWVATFPGLFILISVLVFNLFGDGLGEVLNPKLRRG